MKVRVRFSKMGLARFFSHLDLQRTVERTLRRAGIPLAYTQGFNPHPRLVFASALATGTSSEGEFFDVELAEAIEPCQLLARVNLCSPPGLQFMEAWEVGGKTDSLMSMLNAAAYRIRVTGADHQPLLETVRAFLAADRVVIEREGRSGPRTVDIRPQVYRLEVTGPGEFLAVTQTGQQGNLRPEDLVHGLQLLMPAASELTLSQSHRLMLYRRDPETEGLLEPWAL